MYSIESVLPIFEVIDGANLAPDPFAEACLLAGLGRPKPDGIGLWEVDHPREGTPLILDTVTSPVTLICRLDCNDDYEPEALLEQSLRHEFDANFARCATVLGSRFSRCLADGVYSPPYNWKFEHFLGLNSLIALEQTYYDPIMGVQLLLLLQPLQSRPSSKPVTSAWSHTSAAQQAVEADGRASS